MKVFHAASIALGMGLIASGCSCNLTVPSFDLDGGSGGGTQTDGGGVGGGGAGGGAGGGVGGAGGGEQDGGTGGGSGGGTAGGAGGAGGGAAGGAGGGTSGGAGGGTAGGAGGGAAGGAGGGGVVVDAGTCVDRDGDKYGMGAACLGPDCDDANPAINNNATLRCFSFDAGFLVDGGACKSGSSTCTNGVVGSCMGEVGPSAEQCNGLDDNCNQAVDDGIPAKTCYTGLPASTQGVGICKSGQSSCADAGFGACVGEVTPAPAEVCGNLKDDNCNGATDEAPCAQGTYVCTGCAGSADTNGGTQNAPLKTIGKGIANAVALGAPVVFVAGAVDASPQAYFEDLTIPNGVVVQGRWAVTTGGPSNNWARTAPARTQLTNTSSTGVKFALGATRSTGLEGLSIQAVSTGGATRVIGISIASASPLLRDFTVLGAASASPPSEAVGVLITGGPMAPAFPRLEGTATARSQVASGAGAASSLGVRVTTGRLELQNVNINAGRSNGLSVGLHLVDAPQSDIRDATANGGQAVTCAGLLSQGNAGAVNVENVSAVGCPQVPAGTTTAVTGIGIGFEGCPGLSLLGPPQVRTSNALGGVTTGAKSIAIGGAAVDGCNVNFTGSSLTGGQSSGTNVPETELGLHCGFQGLTNMNGADAACTASKNTLTAGYANSAAAAGLNCVGSCGTKGTACGGSCAEIIDNTISAPVGKTMLHVSITDSSPFLSRNRIGIGANGAISSCATSTVIGVNLDGSGATVVNNMIAGGPCLVALGINQVNDLRTGDASVPAPLVHFNTVVASGAGASPSGATSVAAQFSSSAAVPGAITPRGTWRSNILVAGPVSGPEIVVREADTRSDPAIFWNNLLFSRSATLFPVLYVNEGTTNINSEAGVNGLTDISSQANVHTPPNFVNPAAGDHHINGSSAARGGGSATGAPTVDFDPTDSRPNPIGSNPDIGADEVP